MGGRENSTVLHDRGALVLGRFDCPPGDPLWEETSPGWPQTWASPATAI